MEKKKRQEFLSDLFEYTETKVFEDMMIDYCREKGIDINDVFHEGCRAGFFLAMSMHFSPKNQKTSTFLKNGSKKWLQPMTENLNQISEIDNVYCECWVTATSDAGTGGEKEGVLTGL